MVVICSKPFTEIGYDEYFNKYPFPLSDFQKYSIHATVNGHHSLITAHTGSGKSLPAEFAIEHFVAKGKRVIYTSPIKALSNQKYYDFRMKYPDITFGLMTGDIKMNPDADVLIMTTEILMNYLFTYKEEDVQGMHFQMDIKKELACVVFDEVHYINDADRGYVWEQCILMLPEHVQIIMLSATIDSPEKFAKWCEKEGSSKQVFLSSTSHRIVPLKHYAYMITNETAFKNIRDKSQQLLIRENTDKLMLVKDADGSFNNDTVLRMKNVKNLLDDNRIFVKKPHVLNKLTKHLYDNDMLPAIVFVFSRKNVEHYAKQITTPVLEFDSNIPLIIARECDQIIRKLPNYKEIVHLPEYVSTISLLEKGIGIHHSGMLPVLREITEMMISKKYINLLFATESFAIGLNCPIRSAVFTSLTKFDGNKMRFLHPHEYNQAASRCGRRGIDTLGQVIHCNNMFDLPTETDYKNILCGSPQTLVSKFRISFQMILNMMQNGACKYENFHKFAEQSMLNNELNIAIYREQQYLTTCKKDLEEKTLSVGNSNISRELCDTVLNLKSVIITSVNKKRRQLEKELRDYYTNNAHLDDQLNSYIQFKESEQVYNKQDIYCRSLSNYIDTNVKSTILILVNENFITLNSDENYEFTNKGIIASQMSEIHSLVITDTLISTDFFKDFTPQQIICILSCFVDIKVPDDYKVHSFPINDYLTSECIKNINVSVEKYAILENTSEIYSGIDYDGIISYNIASSILDWCNCSNEFECKRLIETQLYERDISIGEFTKAVMKISAMTNELIKMCESINNIELLHKLSGIDNMILKFVTTNQSLYV
jgi:superfamily II RNA helicase